MGTPGLISLTRFSIVIGIVYLIWFIKFAIQYFKYRRVKKSMRLDYLRTFGDYHSRDLFDDIIIHMTVIIICFAIVIWILYPLSK